MIADMKLCEKKTENVVNLGGTATLPFDPVCSSDDNGCYLDVNVLLMLHVTRNDADTAVSQLHTLASCSQL